MQASLKKTILIVIVSIAGLLLVAGAGLYFYFTTQFTVYQDAQYKFSIKYPKTWKVVIHPKPNVAVVFLRPKDTPLDILQENFSVVVQPISVQDHELAVFTANVRKQMTAVFDKNIKIIKDAPVNWSWRQGHEMVFVALKPDHLVMASAWLLRVDQAYLLTFLGDINKYSTDGWYVEEMIRSLQLQ